MTDKTRLMLKLQSALFLVLMAVVVGLLAWASNRYVLQFDWTASGRNSLSEASHELLKKIDGPVEITAYAREDRILRQAIRDLVGRYRRHKSDLELIFVNPDRKPQEVRRLGITADGELLVRFAERSARVRALNEQSLTNALLRVVRSGERRVVYLRGHGERDLLGRANHDLGAFGTQLESRGYSIIGLDLADVGEIPANARTLVLSQGDIDLLPGEIAQILEFLAGGGNVLWLLDPEINGHAKPLADALGVRVVPGRVLEPTARVFGLDDPTFIVATKYGRHPSTDGFNLVTVFPGAAAVSAKVKDDWEVIPLISTSRQSWSEVGESGAQARRDGENEAAGPLDIGLAFSRPGKGNRENKQQRVVLIGDGDFLSNAFIGNAGNLQFGLNLLDWLGGDDEFINLPANTPEDLQFSLTRGLTLVVGFVPLAVMPMGLLALGFFVWRRRQTR